MKTHFLFIVLFCASVLSVSGQTGTSTLFDFKCDDFKVSASKEMSVGNAPHNWVSATGEDCESRNVFAQVFMTGNMSYLGKSVRFGKSAEGDENCGYLALPAMNLKSDKNEKVVLKVSATSGSNKTGILKISVDGKEIGEIVARTGKNGKPFGRGYELFEFEIKNGRPESVISFEHSRDEQAGLIYVNSIQVIKTVL